MRRNSGIYIITNTESGKFYIGSTVYFQDRWSNHKGLLHRDQHPNPHLQAAWNKYGEAAFKFGILEHLDNPEELHLAEQFWMDVYRLEGKELYNCGLAAKSSMLGRHHTEETRRKLSAINKGKHHTEETRQKMSVAHKGKYRSKEHCRNLSKSHKGKRLSIEIKGKIGAANSKSHPAFLNKHTGKIIPAGINLSSICKKYNLNRGNMSSVKDGTRRSCQGWILYEER